MLCSPAAAVDASNELIEATMLIRAKRFFHFFTQASSGGGDATRPKAFAMAAFTHLTSRERLAALECRSTAQRFSWATRALSRKQRLLRAEATLYDACARF